MDAVAHWIATHKTVVDEIGIDALLAFSVWIVLSCGQLLLGSAGFAAVGGYASTLFVSRGHWPVPAAFLAGVAAAAVAGYLLGLPLARAGRAQFAIATFGFGSIASVMLRVPPVHGSPTPVSSVAIFGVLALCAYAVWRFLRSREGRAFAAVASDEYAASAVGINPARCKHASLVAAALIAGVAGALAAFHQPAGAVSDFGMSRSFEALACTIVGGSGAIGGPVVGAAVLGLWPSFAPHAGPYRTAIDAAALLVFAILLPRGLTSFPIVFRVTRAAAPTRGGGR